MELITVIAGSALGGIARFWLADAVARTLAERFPWGTLVVNVSGALLAGVVAALLLQGAGETSIAWQLGVAGFLGSYTTVSSFSLQTLALAHERAWRRVAANIALSLGLCLPAAGAGLLLGDRLVEVLS